MTPQTTQSMEFSRPEYWSGYPIPLPRDLPDPGIDLGSLTLQVDSLPAELPAKPKVIAEERKVDVHFRRSLWYFWGARATLVLPHSPTSVLFLTFWSASIFSSKIIKSMRRGNCFNPLPLYVVNIMANKRKGRQ